jgi:type II secretory pathway component PulL
LVAQPLRALLDLITLRKLDWQELAWLTDGMRIDEQMLRTITRSQIRVLSGVYKQKRPNVFLGALSRELHLD